MPDLIKGAAISFDGKRTQPLTGNRGTSWTLLFWTSAAGESIAPLMIFPEPLSSQRAELGITLISNSCTEEPTDIQPRISFAPNGWMNTLTFENELRIILPELRKTMPFDQAGLLIYDAHSTHISTRSIQIAKFFGFHLLTIPSHCSILLQPLDSFFNGEFARVYRQMYQDAWVRNRAPRASDKLRAVLLAFRDATKKTFECQDAWRRCGIKNGFPSPNDLRPEKFFPGQSFRDNSCPSITPGYLRVLYSWENLISPTHDTISGDGLARLLSRTEAAADIKKAATELVQLISSRSSESPQNLSLVLCSSDNGPSTYFLPRVRGTITHSVALLRSQQLLDQASSSEHERSPEVIKEVGCQLAIEIAAGTILTCQSIAGYVQVSEAVIEAKHAAQQHRASWKATQEPIWQNLLQHAINRNLVPPTTQLNKQSVLKLDILKDICKKLNIPKTGIQIAVANRLLHHFGETHSLVAYSQPDGEAEVEENELNDDAQL